MSTSCEVGIHSGMVSLTFAGSSDSVDARAHG